MLSEASVQRIHLLKQKYQHPQSAVLDALWLWQDEHGWISEEGMKFIADTLGIPHHHVLGVVSFYTMFNRKPVGKHKLEVCTNVSCMLRNSEKLLKHIEETLHIKAGETTEDKRFTLVETECLGSCGTAPVMQVGESYYENLDETKVDTILRSLR